MSSLTQKELMLRGELYHAFSPELIAERERCSRACHVFNSSSVPRLQRINLWNDIVQRPHFPEDTPESVLDNAPWVEAPFHADYGYNIELGENVYINFNCTILDTCKVTIKSRTLLGPNISLYAGTHPLDAELRNGTRGPELGKEIVIEEDCWIGGNVTILPGVTIGRRSIVGAGAVVTKDVPPDCIVVGNPAKIIRRLGPEPEADGADRKHAKKPEATDLVGLAKRMQALETELKDTKAELRETKIELKETQAVLKELKAEGGA